MGVFYFPTFASTLYFDYWKNEKKKNNYLNNSLVVAFPEHSNILAIQSIRLGKNNYS